MSRKRPYQRPVLAAVISTAGLLLVSTSLYALLWFLDFGWWTPGVGPFRLFGDPDAADVVAGFGEVTVAVLGIAITVVAIIVELAANRYTPRVTELFIRDPINAGVLSFFAVTAALVLATAMSLYGEAYPNTMVIVTMGAMLLSILAILPYFLYVFDFLTPDSVIRRIQGRALDGLGLGARGEALVGMGQRELRTGVEQLGDIALNSILKKDKAIAIDALTALFEVAERSVSSRGRHSESWYSTAAFAGTDQDFVSFHARISERVSERRTWVEVKVLRQFQGAYGEALHDLQDVAHIVAILTVRLALQALKSGEIEVVHLCMRFVHTYFRQAINARDVRSAYNVFNEYRTLGEALLDTPHEPLVLRLVDRARFYGQLAFQRELPFILETAAYDTCTLLETAFDRGSACHDAVLDVVLELDREPDGGEHQEASLRGVRKAQIKLATFYLTRGNEPLARRIFEDMRHEPKERLRSIRQELEAIEDAEFWEVTDRGVDFDWMPAAQKQQLDAFFGWFGEGGTHT